MNTTPAIQFPPTAVPIIAFNHFASTTTGGCSVPNARPVTRKAKLSRKRYPVSVTLIP